MPKYYPPNRSAEYRLRADEARQQAGTATEETARKKLLETADTWERMAAWEDAHNSKAPATA